MVWMPNIFCRRQNELSGEKNDPIGSFFTYRDFSDILQIMDVITIGTATRDIFIKTPDVKILKDPAHLTRLGFKTGEAECFAFGSKIEVERPVFTVGGGAANAAVTFRRQGLATTALVRVGKDPAGDAIIAQLEHESILPLIAYDRALGTAYSTILLAPGGERTILVYRGASETLQRREIPFSKLKAQWAYIAPGAISFALIGEIVKHLKKQGVKIAMNPSRSFLEAHGSHLKPLLKDLDVLLTNREEAALFTGIAYSNEKAIFRKFDELTPGIAVVTDGERGVKISDGRYLYTAGVFKEKRVADRTGAGDAFGSGFVAGLIKTNDINSAIRLGLANATSVIEEVGAQEGILTSAAFKAKRWQQYLNLDIDPL